ncbi:Hsp90 co-chaperone Cdc37 [Aphelenchoides avenae]|nr:Hsp90 co-chaperone Cdc37 [Aphelenchus avenae]
MTYAAPQTVVTHSGAAPQHRHSVDTAMLPSGSAGAPGGHLLDLDVWDQIKSKVDQQPAEWSRHDDLETARIAADLKRFAETEMNRNSTTFAELKRPVELAEADSTFVEDADGIASPRHPQTIDGRLLSPNVAPAPNALRVNSAPPNDQLVPLQQQEQQKIKDDEEKFRAKERELEEKERLQPWNVDTIGHEAWSKSIINKAADKKKTPEPAKVDEEEDSKRMTKYFQENESLLQKYALLDGFDKCEEFLLEHPHLASDYAASYITIEALNLAIEYKEDEMAKYAANCITLQYLLELAKTLNALATNTNVIKNFFKKIKAADAAYMKMYYDEVEAFKDRLRKRAQTKREEALQEYEADEKAKRVAQAPGGLDPQEVYDALPEEMQEAFSSQDMKKLFGVAESMDPEVFQYHLQRCIDSGLWIPNAKEAEEKEKAGATAAQKTTAAAADKKE